MIPVCSPLMNGNEEKYVLNAMRTNWISSSGKYIELFENEFAKYCGTDYGIAVTNGTNALHTALSALGIKKGDEVIIPNFTMIASANAVCYTGAKPIFVDAEPRTWNIDTNKIEEKITSRTKAIMPVHIFGHPCEMDKINELAEKYNLKVIEDAAEAHGAEYKGKRTGKLGDIACFSFFANKIITTGEGGMIITNNEDLAERCMSFKNMYFGKERNYVHEEIGFNYRISNLHSAIGLAQTEKAKEYVNLRIKNNNLYKEGLKGVEEIIFQKEEPWAKNVYWMNAIVLKGFNRDKLMNKLKEKGIETRLLFTGMNKQPCLKKFGGDMSGEYPITDWLTKNGLYLPSGSGLKAEEIKIVCNSLKKILSEK